MADLRITNCHIHTFTPRHVPALYPHAALWIFKRIPGLVRLLAFLLRPFFPKQSETLDRLLQFQRESDVWRQEQIFEKVMRHYPGNTRFVVLPVDMEGIGHGKVPVPLGDQHDELAALTEVPRYKDRLIPFATLNPAVQGRAEEVRRMIVDRGFRGLKIYPRMGFPPDHPVLMNEVYPLMAERSLPVMTHCSRGGVSGAGLPSSKADRYTDPMSYIPVLKRFPDLRICLAHFGGLADWKAYVDEGFDPDDLEEKDANWQVAVRRLICSGEYPALWTDISYTLFHFDDYVPFLRLFLMGEDDGSERLRQRVLFGSDFYMTRQETLSERAVCFRLRNALGEEMFRRIAEENPEVWLGERAPRPYP